MAIVHAIKSLPVDSLIYCQNDKEKTLLAKFYACTFFNSDSRSLEVEKMCKKTDRWLVFIQTIELLSEVSE